MVRFIDRIQGEIGAFGLTFSGAKIGIRLRMTGAKHDND
jgi:hypothetical protein